MAGVAVGALALTFSTSVPTASAHGWTNAPISRAKYCQAGTAQNCGNIQWEPQSVEGPKGFPNGGPADGKLCSAGIGAFAPLDDQRGGGWPTNNLRSGQSYTFKWHFTAMHSTTDFRYYITKNGWNSNAPLTRGALELNPFLTVPFSGRPPADISHSGTLPGGKSGRHMILSVWTIADTGNAFYQCSDVNF
ncbi:chitin-binding protein [Kribbella antibiotica]|uniref:Chitin-binding protein n=2 Tax=Kribbella antibiotica TaxID=190195 RepID=A0A4R4ZQJ8_9ACTN|nr:chitin-binding protein [Kribbella antibiotica]